MALLWKKIHEGTTYEVRTAGRSRRLYTDGVLHSQINPNKAVTGYVWDLLMLPAFFFAKGKIKRVLILGVGGGSVITLLQRFVRPKSIIGIELNPIHLYIAKRFFYINPKSVRLVQADAGVWLKNFCGPPFNMIVDDLFVQPKNPKRAIAASKKWIRLMRKHLANDGVLVSNFISAKELRNSGYVNEPSMGNLFESAYRLTVPRDENVVSVFLRKHRYSRELKQNINANSKLHALYRSGELRFHIKKISL